MLALGVSTLLVSQSAFAAPTADSDISITRGESVQITGIDDWLIGVFTATSTIPVIQYNWDFQCVYTSTGLFRVDLISSNGLSPLTLESSGGDQMRYEIWAFHRRAGAFALDGPYITPTFGINNLEGSTSLTCADEGYGGNNLFFAALVRPANFNAAPPGIYQDVVTLIVSQE